MVQALRFGASTAAIGAVFGTMDLAMMGFMLLTPKMAATVGRLKVIVLTRFISSASFVAMAFSPFFPLAGAFLVLRGAFAMGGMPVRQSFVMLNVHDSERASANGATSFSRNTASSVGAAASGYVMRLGLESLPLLGGLIAMLDPLLYYAMFREQWDERRLLSLPMPVAESGVVEVPDHGRDGPLKARPVLLPAHGG
ncbi:MAG: MFS transporter [TACK group archaeon]|nr:MFS transporter [TACK group archaeon]